MIMPRMLTFAKTILVVLILAFIALMVFEWGADINSSSGRQANIIGVINGEEIDYQVFQNQIQVAQNNARANGTTEMSVDEEATLRNQVWENIVRSIVLREEVQRLDIGVSDREISDYIVDNPPQEALQAPDLQTNGVFDKDKYVQLLQSNQQYTSSQSAYLRDQLPYIKLEQLITSGAIVTEEEVRREFASQNVKSNIDFLHIPVNGFRDETVVVSDAEAQTYYNDNRKDFEQDERRKVNFVMFSILPTAGDTSRILKRAEQLKKDALGGKDFSDLAKAYSEDPSAAQNSGDLGYFSRTDMVKEFSDAAFAAKPGEIVGPVKTSYGYHIIKVEDKKVEEKVEKVKALHILLNIVASVTTRDNAYADAELFAELSAEIDFKAAADSLKQAVMETPEFPKNTGGNIPGLARNYSAMGWIFEADLGDISPVFSSATGNFVCELTAIDRARYVPFETVKENCINKVKLERQRETARKYAESLAGRVASGEEFNEIAESAEQGKVMVDSTGQFPLRNFLPKIGQAPSIVAAAFALPIGEASGMLESARGFYFINVKERVPFDETAYQAQRAGIRNRLLRNKRNEAFRLYYTALKEKANIIDNRHSFYRS